MNFKPSRKWIGIASAVAVLLFVTNPEIFALSFVISSMGLDIFLLFLTFQLRDQFNYLKGWLFSWAKAKKTTCSLREHDKPVVAQDKDQTIQ